jgi:hypothetical protein
MKDYYNDPNITTANQDYQTAANTAATYQSAASLLPDKLKDAIQSKLDYNKDIIEAQNKAMAEYFMAPSKAREENQDVWNPFQREALVAKERAMAYQPYATLTDVLSARKGYVTDVIDKATGAFDSDVTAKNNAATLKRQLYTDLLGVADKKQAQSNWEKEFALSSAKENRAIKKDIDDKTNETDKLTAETWAELQYDDITKAQRTADQIWKIINRDQDALRRAGIDVDALWKWQKQMKDTDVLNTSPEETSSVNAGGLLDWLVKYQPANVVSDAVQGKK